ncbi:hypothetical protein LJ601_002180 [Acinetobacter baumannii]|nr:hypothetical protein [Acinetobacter baumannii]
MSNSIDDQAVVYSQVIDGVKVENFYSYAYLKDGVFLGLGCNSTLNQIAEKLKSWGYSEVSVWVESEVEFYKRKLNFGKVVETTKQAFDEAFNCLPPVRHTKYEYAELFMMSEETAAGYFTFYMRIGSRYFCVLEHYRKSFGDIEKIIKTQMGEQIA